MNYFTIYHRLITNAQTRKKVEDEYYEKHHIVPRCLGGNDSVGNLVALTAREHYIAHLCLIKMYPNNHKLVRAAIMMCCSSENHKRSGNRIYEWLRKKHQTVMKESQSGIGNSQYSTKWIFNTDKKIEKKINTAELESYLSQGWIQGRKNSVEYKCIICSKKFFNKFQKKTCSKECSEKQSPKFQVFEGKEEEFLKLYNELKSMNKALQAMGYKGAVSHYYRWAKNLINQQGSI